MFEMGAKFDEDIFDTSKERKNVKQSEEAIDKKEHQLVFKYEKRRGKPVTLVGEFRISQNEKKDVLKLLKNRLACGGTIKENWIEIQGKKEDDIKTILLLDGWKLRN
jgi:translation initiation factor 1